MTVYDELRASVLQAAIQGKLTKQLPEDGDARDLLAHIKKELNNDWRAKREKSLDVLLEDCSDSVIPDNWCWVKLSDISSSNIGLTYSPTDKSDDGVIVLRSSNIQKSQMDYSDLVKVCMNIPESKMCNIGDILMCARNGSKSLVGKVAVIDRAGMAFGAFMAIIRSICNPFIFIFFNSELFKSQMRGDSSTQTINQITQDMLHECIIPLPPLAEQHRIVARVEELMTKIDELEKIENELEELKKAFPEDMKAALLQAAMQGKLTKQRAEDGTAKDLLDQINKEKSKLVLENGKKKIKPTTFIKNEEEPFDIPDCWSWVTFNSLFFVLNGDRGANYPAKSTLLKSGEIPFISALNLNGKNVTEDEQLLFVSEDQYEKLRAGKLEHNDMVMCIRGSLGKHGRFQFDKGAIASSLVIIRPIIDLINGSFLSVYLDSPLLHSEIKRFDNGTAQPNLAAASLEQFAFPLPPLAEQKRIVEKLDQLLPLCEDLTEEKLIRAAF